MIFILLDARKSHCAVRFLAATFLTIGALHESATKAAQAGLPPANLCDTPGHRQFDFWVGQWDVFDAASGTLVAHSNIEKLYGGCAVRENWMPLKGLGGGSLNTYRRSTGTWRQVWTDSGNELHEYSGALTAGKIDLKGTASNWAGTTRRIRMTLEPMRDGTVVQTGYAWSSKRRKWTSNYSLLYRLARGH